MWQATIIAGLPGEGPWPEQFTHDGASTHSEGIVVHFILDDGTEWTGNFQPGASNVSSIRVHPNGVDAIVIAAGQGYEVSVSRRELVRTFGGYITDVLSVPNEPTFIFADSGVAFEAWSHTGFLWRTPQVSYDGFRNLRITGGKLVGEGWWPIGDE